MPNVDGVMSNFFRNINGTLWGCSTVFARFVRLGDPEICPICQRKLGRYCQLLPCPPWVNLPITTAQVDRDDRRARRPAADDRAADREVPRGDQRGYRRDGGGDRELFLEGAE